LIARDQVRKVTTAINVERAKSAGITKFRWRHSGGGSEPRQDHVDMDGMIFSYDDPPVIDERTGERGYPGQLINCHPGHLSVEVAHGCMKLYRRRYSGELVSLVSANGVVLQATPNHPILTSKGWKAAKDINLGDYLVKGSYQAIDIPEADVKNPVSTFGEFFDAACRLFGKHAAASAGSAFEFHGDRSDGEVDIVYIRDCLPLESDSSALQQLRELVFSYSDSAFDPGSCDRASDEFVMASLLSADSRVGSLCALLSELRAEPSRADIARSRLIAYLDAAFSQNPSYGSARDSVFFSQLKLAHAEGVLCGDLLIRQLLAISSVDSLWDGKAASADSLGEIVRVDAEFIGHGGEIAPTIEHLERVVDKGVSEFSSHVYNLETASNWYVTEGIISHNCRCQAVPVLEWGDPEK
jgi:hypothetical protein